MINYSLLRSYICTHKIDADINVTNYYSIREYIFNLQEKRNRTLQ